MKSLYEVLNVDLVNEYTKERKKAIVEKLAPELGAELEAEVNAAIDAMDIPESDERHHWIQKIGKTAGADLLTLGKVQPENMLAMGSLPTEDYHEAVKVAVSHARGWNQATINAEKELNEEQPPQNVTI
jgi:hypothetical protein